MKPLRVISVAIAMTVLVACASSSSSGTAGSANPGGELTVFAASSLTAAFNQIGTDFEAANPGTTVTFNYGSSTDLAAQVASEGTAGVFASASATALETGAKDPGGRGRTRFATHQLGVITPAADPAGRLTLPGPEK